MFPEIEYLGTLANDNYFDYFDETDMVDKYRLICSLVLNIYRIFQNDTQRQICMFTSYDCLVNESFQFVHNVSRSSILNTMLDVTKMSIC